jgi:hypothetical protein
MVLYTGQEEQDQFLQYAYDGIQLCHFVHEYEDKLNNDEYQLSEIKYVTYGIHHLNQSEQIYFLAKIRAQPRFEIDEKQRRHETSQQKNNIIYILYAHQQK